MGVSNSRSVTETLIEATSNVVSTIISTVEITGNASQLIYVRNAANVNISGITQRLQLEVNMDAVMNTMSDLNVQQELIQNLTVASTAITSGINFGQSSSASNEISTVMKAFMDITSTITNTCNGLTTSSQSIVVEQVSGFVNINNVVQESTTIMLASCMQDTTSSITAVQTMENIIDQTTLAKSQGLDLTMILVMIAVIIAVFGLTFGMMTAKMGTMAIKIGLTVALVVTLITAVAGIGLILYFIVSIRPEPFVKLFSPMFKFTPECGSVELSTHTDIMQAAEAGSRCIDDELCIAYDWHSIDLTEDGTPIVLPEPITTFYSELRVNPCGAVENGVTDQQIIFRPTVHKYVGLPPPTGLEGVRQGDMGVNRTLLRLYYRSGTLWLATGNGYNELIPEADPETDDPYNVTDGLGDPDEDGEDGDVYMDMANPSRINVWQWLDSEWVLKQEAMEASGYRVDTSCFPVDEEPPDPDFTVLGVPAFGSALSLSRWFTQRRRGMLTFLGVETGDVQDTTLPDDPDDPDYNGACTNVSGWEEMRYEYGMLILGVVMFVVGIAMTGLLAWLLKKMSGEGDDDDAGPLSMIPGADLVKGLKLPGLPDAPAAHGGGGGGHKH